MKIHFLKKHDLDGICIHPMPTKPCIQTFSQEKSLFCPFAIFLESLKVLFSYTMKSIFPRK